MRYDKKRRENAKRRKPPESGDEYLNRLREEAWDEWAAIELVMQGEDPYWVCIETGIWIEREDQ